MKNKWIIPPTTETMITGFSGALEMKIGKSNWRVEYWTGEQTPRVYKNETLLDCPIEDLPLLAFAAINNANQVFGIRPQ